ncbi:hypothetical protein Tco_1279995, partial [Tanacetum coccineum]
LGVTSEKTHNKVYLFMYALERLVGGGHTWPGCGPCWQYPTNYYLGSSRNAECSNCKHLRGKISVLKATMDMHMHPEQHTVNSAALLHEVLNEMEKLDLE